ncbi:MAG: zf-HC2 domain-containing protein [Deltaproteobacteria bacterium]
MLSCKQITELVTDFLEGRMSLADRLRFQMHVGMCKHCRAYLRQMKATVTALGRLPEEPMPDDVRDELRKRFADWHEARAKIDKNKPEPT